jgi:SAM-dependent methyltransferase
MNMLENKVIDILKRSPADQYSIYAQIAECTMSDITRIIADLSYRKTIEVVSHRKNIRTGLEVPIYALSLKKTKRTNRFDIDGLTAGIYSERIIEYKFLANNLPSPNTQMTILDVGTDESQLIKKLQDYGTTKWQIYGIDISDIKEKSLSKHLIRMDGRVMAFRQGIFDLVICISTIEHIGIPSMAYNIKETDIDGDSKLMREMNRVLKHNGRLILTLPYGNRFRNTEHRIYNRLFLDNLIRDFSVIKRNFYLFNKGRWKRLKDEQTVDKSNIIEIPPSLHSPILTCLCLQKS